MNIMLKNLRIYELELIKMDKEEIKQTMDDLKLNKERKEGCPNCGGNKIEKQQLERLVRDIPSVLKEYPIPSHIEKSPVLTFRCTKCGAVWASKETRDHLPISETEEE